MRRQEMLARPCGMLPKAENLAHTIKMGTAQQTVGIYLGIVFKMAIRATTNEIVWNILPILFPGLFGPEAFVEWSTHRGLIRFWRAEQLQQTSHFWIWTSHFLSPMARCDASCQ